MQVRNYHLVLIVIVVGTILFFGLRSEAVESEPTATQPVVKVEEPKPKVRRIDNTRQLQREIDDFRRDIISRMRKLEIAIKTQPKPVVAPVNVNINVENTVSGGTTQNTVVIEGLQEKFEIALPTNRMTFEEYDEKLAMLSTSIDLDDPEDYEKALQRMALVSTEYWGIPIRAEAEDVFSKWKAAVDNHRRRNPGYKSAALDTLQYKYNERGE